MQNPKTLLTCGAAALCLIATSARAVDSADDIKLREALHQRMSEVGPETSAPVKPVKAPKPPKAPKAPKAAAPAVVVEPAPVAPAVVSEPAVAAPVVVQPAPVAAPVQSTAATDEERLRAAVRARLAEGQPPANTAQPVITSGTDLQPVVSSTTIVAPTPAPATVQAPSSPVVVAAPASPIPASKEQRLAALLQQYKSDLITPQQYHEERAKILAE